MNTNDLKEMAELYLDNELEKSKEPLLFSSLAVNDEAREYFFNLNILRKSVQHDLKQFPPALEERIFTSLKESKQTQINYYFKGSFGYLAAATAALFIIISTFLFYEVKGYQEQVNSIVEQVNIQNRTIDLILDNSLPPAEVRSRSINEVIVRSNL